MQNNAIMYSNQVIDSVFKLNNNNNSKTEQLLTDLQSHMFSIKNLTQFTKYNTDNINNIKNRDKKQKSHLFSRFNRNNNNITKINNPVKKMEIFEPKEKDTLFWCFYVLTDGFGKYDMLGNQQFVEEKQLKFKYIDLIRSKKDILKMHKIRPITELEDDLANKPQIGMKTFIALCILKNVNVMVVHKHKYYESINNNSSDSSTDSSSGDSSSSSGDSRSSSGDSSSSIVHIITRTDEPLKYSLDLNSTTEKIDNYKNNYYKMSSFDGGLKAISSYKLDELIELCKKLGIEIVHETKKKTKKEIYEMIVSHF